VMLITRLVFWKASSKVKLKVLVIRKSRMGSLLMKCPFLQTRFTFLSKWPSGDTFLKLSRFKVVKLFLECIASSSSLFVPTSEQIKDPAEEPQKIDGSSCLSSRTEMTPKWNIPMLAPPENMRLVLP